MSEEIKEILYYFEKYHFEDTMIDGKETKLLHDYITDLETALDKIKDIVNNEKVSGIEAKLMIKDILEERK